MHIMFMYKSVLMAIVKVG